jgi:site-specific recombinase XerD
MHPLKYVSVRPKTQTVSVYTRHSADCSKKGEPQWRRCKCAKYLYLLRDGNDKTISARTCSWEKAEQQAQEIRDSWDPVKQRLRELDELKQARELGEVTITHALERWLASVKADSDSGNEHTHSKYRTAAKHIGAWAHSNHLIRLSQITPDALDHWKSSWSPKAKNPDDRIGKTTAGRRLEKLKRFLSYCVKMHWLAKNPATELKAIKPDLSVTWPLLSGRYERVIAATFEYDKRARRPSDQFGADMRAIIELMRWTGLRIGDALMCAKSRIQGNRFSLTTQNGKSALTVLIPDHVIAALNALPLRADVHPDYFFWSGNSKHKSLTGRWQRKLERLNDYLSIAKDDGTPMRFHSHQLRDTFAVTQLLSGTSMQDLSKMLSHKSVKITEKYYSPWVPERQAALERRMAETLVQMGVSVSL